MAHPIESEVIKISLPRDVDLVRLVKFWQSLQEAKKHSLPDLLFTKYGNYMIFRYQTTLNEFLLLLLEQQLAFKDIIQSVKNQS